MALRRALATRGACAALAAGVVAGLTPASCEKVFESCEAIGDGMGAAIWERRHDHVVILERDNEQVQRLVTALRDKATKGAEWPQDLGLAIYHPYPVSEPSATR
jgi:hypothetical protein